MLENYCKLWAQSAMENCHYFTQHHENPLTVMLLHYIDYSYITIYFLYILIKIFCFIYFDGHRLHCYRLGPTISTYIVINCSHIPNYPNFFMCFRSKFREIFSQSREFGRNASKTQKLGYFGRSAWTTFPTKTIDMLIACCYMGNREYRDYDR